MKRSEPFINESSRAGRIAWVEEDEEPDYERVISTDEAAIEMGEDIWRSFTQRRPGEEFDVEHITPTFRNTRQVLMVWGAVVHGKKWPL